MAHILAIDDDPAVISLITKVVRGLGHVVVSRQRLADGLAAAETSDGFDLVFLDVNLPDGSGLELLPRFRETAPKPDVVIMTGLGDPDGAEMAIRNGAWDYVQKPLTPRKIELPLTRVLQFRESQLDRQTSSVALVRDGIIGQSPGMTHCFDLVAQAGGGDMSVLITGETGTGKELFARAVHANSLRRHERFVIVDCTVLPETLVESALFGHRRGAFTGADTSRQGLIGQAHRGTLFLDEIGEMPLKMQKAFLRVLQEKRFRAVGSGQEIISDFRLVAATNRDPDQMTAEGRFRKDLLFRIKALNIHLPPLRERSEDIKPLAMHHLTKACERRRIGTKGVAPDFIDALMRYTWPGNVRELVNVMDTAIGGGAHAETLSSAHLPMQMRIQIAREGVRAEPAQPASIETAMRGQGDLPTFRERINAAEQIYLRELITMTAGDVKACSHLSGLSRSRVYALLKKHGIKRKF